MGQVSQNWTRKAQRNKNGDTTHYLWERALTNHMTTAFPYKTLLRYKKLLFNLMINYRKPFIFNGTLFYMHVLNKRIFESKEKPTYFLALGTICER